MNNVVTCYENDYERGYDAGYAACMRKARERESQKRQQKEALRRKELYFLKQKLVGVFFLAFSIIAAILMGGDATLTLLTIPLSAALIFSRRMLLADKYYFETKEREENLCEIKSNQKS